MSAAVTIPLVVLVSIVIVPENGIGGGGIGRGIGFGGVTVPETSNRLALVVDEKAIAHANTMPANAITAKRNRFGLMVAPMNAVRSLLKRATSTLARCERVYRWL